MGSKEKGRPRKARRGGSVEGEWPSSFHQHFVQRRCFVECFRMFLSRQRERPANTAMAGRPLHFTIVRSIRRELRRCYESMLM